MPAELHSVEVEIIPDEDPDISYLEQPEFAERLAAYNRGEFHFVGVRAVAEIRVPYGLKFGMQNSWVTETVHSPGLWGIENDSDDEYFEQIGCEECSILRDLLLEMGVKFDRAEYDREYVKVK